MRALEQNVVVEEDGSLSLHELPVKAGDRVKVILLLTDEEPTQNKFYPLRDTRPYRFIDPTAPVAPDDWEPEQ
jgi:hypothetical protein